MNICPITKAFTLKLIFNNFLSPSFFPYRIFSVQILLLLFFYQVKRITYFTIFLQTRKHKMAYVKLN